MNVVYEVIMIDSHCPSETCSIGICDSMGKAELLIEKERVQYSEHMIFEIEEKYIQR